jgi:hypothetical protein
MSTHNSNGFFSNLEGGIDNLFDDFSSDNDTKKPITDQSDAGTSTGIRRSSKDFNPDMDILVLTAQSPMITDAIKLFFNSDYSKKSVEIYQEALRGINIYIKILDRNPQNYMKLQSFISTDSDCQEVEKTAFILFEKKYQHIPTDNKEKIISFELLLHLIKNAHARSILFQDIEKIRPFLTLHGTVNKDAINSAFKSSYKSLEAIVESFHNSVIVAKNIVERNQYTSSDIRKERVRISGFLLSSSFFLYHFYSLKGELDLAKKYLLMHETHKKYFISR